jgi:hypothetical protein
MINHKRFWLTVFIAFIPILIITMTVFIFFIYPEQKYDLYDEDSSGVYYSVNELYISMNESNFKFGCSMSLLSSIMLAGLCAVGYNTYKINSMDPIVVSAKVIAKDIRGQSYNTRGGVTQVATYFVVDFEFEDMTTRQFSVNATQFSLMFEGNVGLLVYKEYLKLYFIDFIVESIN